MANLLMTGVKFLGKAEGKDKLWHGHVTAVTVSPEFRRLGLAHRLMNHLEDVTEKQVCCVNFVVKS